MHSNSKSHFIPSLVWSPSIPASKPAGNRTELPPGFPEQAGCPWRVSSLSAAGDDPTMAGGQTAAHKGPSHKRTCPPEKQRQRKREEIIQKGQEYVLLLVTKDKCTIIALWSLTHGKMYRRVKELARCLFCNIPGIYI